MTKTPASTSLLSMNGPSVISSPRIAVAVSGGSSASPATTRPPGLGDPAGQVHVGLP